MVFVTPREADTPCHEPDCHALCLVCFTVCFKAASILAKESESQGKDVSYYDSSRVAGSGAVTAWAPVCMVCHPDVDAGSEVAPGGLFHCQPAWLCWARGATMP